MTEPYALHDSLGYQLTLLSRIHERRFETALAPLGLTRVKWCVLLAIGQADAAPPFPGRKQLHQGLIQHLPGQQCGAVGLADDDVVTVATVIPCAQHDTNDLSLMLRRDAEPGVTAEQSGRFRVIVPGIA